MSVSAHKGTCDASLILSSKQSHTLPWTESLSPADAANDLGGPACAYCSLLTVCAHYWCLPLVLTTGACCLLFADGAHCLLLVQAARLCAAPLRLTTLVSVRKKAAKFAGAALALQLCSRLTLCALAARCTTPVQFAPVVRAAQSYARSGATAQPQLSQNSRQLPATTRNSQLAAPPKPHFRPPAARKWPLPSLPARPPPRASTWLEGARSSVRAASAKGPPRKWPPCDLLHAARGLSAAPRWPPANAHGPQMSTASCAPH